MIKLHEISKSFGEKQVLNNITLNVEKGEVFGLIGKNGAGKTTLLSIIAGLIEPTQGACYINGQFNKKNSASAKVGYLPDVPSFFDFMTVGEFLDFLYQQAPGYKDKRNHLANLVGLNCKTKIKTMSRGMRQRLGLAASLVNDPVAILLDEPSSALDPAGRYELSQILLQLKNEGKTIILSTHILTDMEDICDRVGFLHNGSITKIVSPKNLDDCQRVKLVFEKPLPTDIFIGLALDSKLEGDTSIILSGDLKESALQQDILKRLLSLDNPILLVETMGADLESIFMEVCL